MKLILVRHGAVEGLDPPRFRGRKQLPLTQLGREQATATGRYIASRWAVDAIVTSPLSRCIDTGTLIAEPLGLSPTTSEFLLDFDYGDWAWKTRAEVKAEWPQLYEQWFSTPQLVQIPGGETLQDIVLRAASALRMLLLAHRDETVIAVAHDSINRALLLQLLDMPLSGYWRLKQDPCCINIIKVDERIRVRTVNSTAHLDCILGQNGTSSTKRDPQ